MSLVVRWSCYASVRSKRGAGDGTIIDGTLKRGFWECSHSRGKIRDIGAFKPVAGETVLDVKGGRRSRLH